MIRHGATDWNRGLHCACEGGSLELAELMIQCGATELDKGLRTACKIGFRKIAKS